VLPNSSFNCLLTLFHIFNLGLFQRMFWNYILNLPGRQKQTIFSFYIFCISSKYTELLSMKLIRENIHTKILIILSMQGPQNVNWLIYFAVIPLIQITFSHWPPVSLSLQIPSIHETFGGSFLWQEHFCTGSSPHSYPKTSLIIPHLSFWSSQSSFANTFLLLLLWLAVYCFTIFTLSLRSA
jgi:hypothetical protein